MKPNSPIMRYLLRNNLVDDFVPYGVYMRYVAGLSFLNPDLQTVYESSIITSKGSEKNDKQKQITKKNTMG